MVKFFLFCFFFTMLFVNKAYSLVVECEKKQRYVNNSELHYLELNYDFNDVRVVKQCGKESLVGKVENMFDGFNADVIFDFKRNENGYVISGVHSLNICFNPDDCEFSMSIENAVFEKYGKEFLSLFFKNVHNAYLNDGKGFIDLFSPKNPKIFYYFNKDYRAMYKNLNAIYSEEIEHLSLTEKEIYDETGTASDRYLSLGIHVSGNIFFVYFSVVDSYTDFRKFSTAVI